jgi:hypothetical protein
VHAGFGFGLFTKLGVIVPAIIKQNEDRSNAIMLSQIQVMLDTILKASCILPPEKIMKVNPDRIETEITRPLQFPINCREVKSFRLPHFQLIYGCTGDKITSHQPG